MDSSRLILVTPTWKRATRMDYMRRMVSSLQRQENLLWLLVEDADEIDDELDSLISRSGIESRYWAVGLTKDKGNQQRNAALEYIKERKLEGVVYNADDDNFYYDRLFDELRCVDEIGFFPVGNLGPNEIERPVLREGKQIGWDSNWLEREIPVDMGGFAFSSRLIFGLESPIWAHTGVGGESEFLEKIMTEETEVQFLCDGCKQCLVWHNQDLEEVGDV